MKKVVLLCFCCICIHPYLASSSEVQEKIEKPVEQAISIMQNTQKEEENWRHLQEKLSAELELLEKRVNQLTTFRDNQKEQLAFTNERIRTKKQQLADVKRISEEMGPYISLLIEKLTVLPDSGLPFLHKERQERMAKLVEIRNDPEISVSEQYRKAMEALFIEAEFGVTIETYQEMLDFDNQKTLVNVLRLGRLGLYYITLDESRCGYYNIAEKRWQPLADSIFFHSRLRSPLLASNVLQNLSTCHLAG